MRRVRTEDNIVEVAIATPAMTARWGVSQNTSGLARVCHWSSHKTLANEADMLLDVIHAVAGPRGERWFATCSG